MDKAKSTITFSRKLNNKTFQSLNKHNIKKRFNIWEEDLKTGTITSSHLKNVSSLGEAIAQAKEYQELADKCQIMKFLYHVDIEVLIEDSEGESLLDTGDIAYAITVYPNVNDFCELEMWD